jgi:hypothetical protein
MLRGGWCWRSEYPFGHADGFVLTKNSEKEEIDLQLRAVPDIEERIKELEASG